MYRKHQKMEAEQKHESQFVQRVMNLPVVNSATEQVTDAYNSTKEYSSVLKYTMETAENIVKYGTEVAKPLVEKLEKPISVVDNFACDKLNKLEHSYPIITKPPSEIAELSKNAALQAKNYSVAKVAQMKNYGYETVTNVTSYGYDKVALLKNYGLAKATLIVESDVGQELVKKLDEIVSLSEKYFDILVPAAECEKRDQQIDVPKNTIQRLAILSEKAHLRLRCIALHQLEKLRGKAQDITEELKAVLTLLKERTLLSAKHYNERVNNLWTELTKEQVNQTPENLRENLLQKAKYLASSLTIIFSQSANALTYVSATAKQRFLAGLELANNLYGNLSVVSGAKELTDGALNKVEEIVQKLQEMLVSLGNYIFPSKLVQEENLESIELPDILPEKSNDEDKPLENENVPES